MPRRLPDQLDTELFAEALLKIDGEPWRLRLLEVARRAAGRTRTLAELGLA